ncbi:MAG: hypothetical protein QW353_01075 [Candidatus Korarchaeum sp.]
MSEWKIELGERGLKVSLGELEREISAEEELRSFMSDLKVLAVERKELAENLGTIRAEIEQKWLDFKSPKPLFLTHLTDIENSGFGGKEVVVDAVIASNQIPYLVPRKFKVIRKDEKNGIQEYEFEIPKNSDYIIRLIGLNESKKLSTLRAIAGQKRAAIEIEEWWTVYKVRVRPVVLALEKKGDIVVDDQGKVYKFFDIYIVNEGPPLSLEAGAVVRLHGRVVPDPKNQKLTLLVHEIGFPEGISNYNLENIARLKEKFKGWSVEERVDWILRETEKGSGIIGRKDIALSYYLSAFAVRRLEIEGEIHRGWLNAAVVGDTTAGKSALGLWIMRLLRAGTMITAELATLAGLVATVTQSEGGNWFIDWGVLPLNHRKWVVIDGAHKLSHTDYAALAEAERSGRVTIAKAAKGEFPAEVRLTKIFNPKDPQNHATKYLREFYRPVQALSSVLDTISIARLDCCVFVDSRDVGPEEVNKPREGGFDRDLALLADAVRWVWNADPKVVFDEGVWELILKHATDLYKRYYCEGIPLVSIDMKFKLARMAAALAALTLSTDDNLRLIRVTEEHVEFVVRWLRGIYDKAELAAYAREVRNTEFDVEEAKSMLDALAKKIGRPVEKVVKILQFIVTHGSVTRDQLRTTFGLSERTDLRSLLAELRNLELVKVSRGFQPSSKLIALMKTVESHKLEEESKVIPEPEGEHPFEEIKLEEESKVTPKPEGKFEAQVRCPYCEYTFASDVDLEDHIKVKHSEFSPLIAALHAWREDDMMKLDFMLRRMGRTPKVGETTWFLEKMRTYREKGDMNGWLEFVYSEEQSSLENELILVRFNIDVPKFVGIDLKHYGPFKGGELAYIPRANAEALIQRGAARVEEVSEW